jgi:aerobic C4-dicarboxylate transport protein
VPSVPIAGMALILGIDRFMSECRALTNFIGNAVATIVVSRWERGIDEARFAAVFTHHQFGPDNAVPGPQADPD